MRTIVSILLMVLFCTTMAVAGSFTDNSNGTVTDLTTNLMWQQCSAGLSGASCATGAAVVYTWDNAITYCESLSLAGFTDWRLPNVKELSFLVDDSRTAAPTINITYFPNTQSPNYWSSTTFAPTTTYAWYVVFSSGNTYSYSKTDAYYVRCVRGQ